MDTTLSNSRAVCIMEVLDVTDDDAKAYLIKCGMPETLAIQVVELTGGRLIHLTQAVKTQYHKQEHYLYMKLQFHQLKDPFALTF